jgi:hypothetical protein
LSVISQIALNCSLAFANTGSIFQYLAALTIAFNIRLFDYRRASRIRALTPIDSQIISRAIDFSASDPFLPRSWSTSLTLLRLSMLHHALVFAAQWGRSVFAFLTTRPMTQPRLRRCPRSPFCLRNLSMHPFHRPVSEPGADSNPLRT